MHLALLTQYYPPEIGAPQARLSALAGQLVQRGHSVTVLTAMPNYPTGKIYREYGGLLRRELRDGVHVIRTFVYPTQKLDFAPRLTSYFSFVLSSLTLGSILLPPADYLFVESPPLFLGLSGIWLRRLKRARLIFNVADLWPESAVQLGILRPGGLACRVSAWLEASCYRRAWLVTGQSKSILDDITSRFPDRPTFHLSNGVDTQLFHPDRQTVEAWRTLHSNGTCVALYAGLHGIAQGLDQVLSAANALGCETGMQFVLVGEGPEKQTLLARGMQLGLKNVSFLASRPSWEIPAMLASADIALVITKKYIPGMVPAKLYEAMASGRPVVLVARGEAAEIVRQHEAGIVVEPGDIAGLTRALQELQARPELRQTLGENARRAAERQFDRTRTAARFIDHLEANLCA